MKTQVLLPASNEGARIGRTLKRLPADKFDVRVVVNGSTDDTYEVASRFAPTYEIEEAGKLPALQHGLRKMGASALEAVLILDADTHPVRPVAWARLLEAALRPETDLPTVASSPIVYTPNGTGMVNPFVRSVIRYGDTFLSLERAERDPTDGKQFGPSMGIHLARQQTLDDVLDLPHIWPAEDVALAVAVVDSHPDARFTQVVHPLATAMTPRPKPLQPMVNWLRDPEKARLAEAEAYRAGRSMAGAVGFDEWYENRERP